MSVTMALVDACIRSSPRRCHVDRAGVILLTGRLARAALPVVLVCAAPLTAANEDSASQIEEIVVIESLLAADAVAVGDQTSILGEELHRIGPQDVEQLFKRLPGISVLRGGGPGGVSEVFLRGAESNFTAVIIDGMRLNNPSNTRGGSYDFSMLGIEGVSRIDIASGTMSAIFGSDAMAGVVQIESAWSVPGSVDVFAETGDARQWRLGAGTSADLGHSANFAVNVAAREAGEAVEGSSLTSSSLRSRVAGTWFRDDPWTLNTRYSQRSRTSFPEVSGGPQWARSRELDTADGEEIGLSFSGTSNPRDNWSAELSVNWIQLRDEAFTPAVAPGVLDGLPGFTSSTTYRRSQITWVNRYRPGPRTITAFGLDWVNEDGWDDGGVDFGFAVVPSDYSLDRSTASAFFELGHRGSGGTTVNLAVRGDDHDSDRRVSAKFGISQDLGLSGGRIWARLATGFKLPSFFALGNPLFGNPDLVPETVKSIEAGYSQTAASGRVIGISLFSNRYSGLVDFDFETFKNINKGRIDVDGIELRADFPLADNLRLAADISRNKISSDSGPLRRRPELTGGATVHWVLGEIVQLNVAVRYVGSRLITSVPTGDVVDDGYTYLDATLNLEFSQTNSVWLSVDNATASDYQDAPGFPSPGAQVRIGFRVGL